MKKFKIRLYESNVEKKRVDDYLTKFLFIKNPNILHTNHYLNYLGDLSEKKSIWPEIISSLEALARGEKISNPGWKKILNDNYEYHVRGAYKIVYSWIIVDKRKVLLLKAIGHSALIMPIMNNL
jgi:hypothetical protein